MSIYELLNRIIINEKYSLSSDLFIESDKKELTEEEKHIFELLKNISSLGTRIYNNGIEFHPMFVMADGSRYFSIEDMSKDDYLLLSNLELDKIPLILRALVADILWINKKDFNAAQIAADAYWKLFILWYKDADNIGTIDMIRRAVCISVQTKQTAIYNEIQGWFNDFIFTKASRDESGFALRVMELFFEQKNFDVSIILNVLDELIAYNSANVAKVEQAYKLRAKCLSKLKRKKEERQNNISLADYYLDFAEKTFQKDIQGAWRAVDFYQKGIILYRNNYEAIHILAPQVENLFRAIAQGAGGITVTLEKDGTSMEKVLSSILSLPELMDCYDNDILFIFRGLLNERAGANIRNEIAHGIISESACSTGACLYFGMAVIKLLSLTSSPYYQILKNSEKLKHFEIPSKDTLKIIR